MVTQVSSFCREHCGVTQYDLVECARWPHDPQAVPKEYSRDARSRALKLSSEKATLKDLPTNLRLVIDTFGAQLNGHCPPVPRQSHPAQTIPDDANNIIIRLPVEATQLQRKHVCATWVQGQGPSCPNNP